MIMNMYEYLSIYLYGRGRLRAGGSGNLPKEISEPAGAEIDICNTVNFHTKNCQTKNL